jgi:hypothetical protein
LLASAFEAISASFLTARGPTEDDFDNGGSITGLLARDTKPKCPASIYSPISVPQDLGNLDQNSACGKGNVRIFAIVVPLQIDHLGSTDTPGSQALNHFSRIG